MPRAARITAHRLIANYFAKEQAMTNPASRTAPLLQIRVAGSMATVRTVLDQLTRQVRDELGPDLLYRTHTRAGDRAGAIRGYLTVRTRTEEP